MDTFYIVTAKNSIQKRISSSHFLRPHFLVLLQARKYAYAKTFCFFEVYIFSKDLHKNQLKK